MEKPYPEIIASSAPMVVYIKKKTGITKLNYTMILDDEKVNKLPFCQKSGQKQK